VGTRPIARQDARERAGGPPYRDPNRNFHDAYIKTAEWPYDPMPLNDRVKKKARA
jgi:hypothetical protein